VLFCLFVIAYSCRVLDVSAGRYLAAGWLRPACAAVVPAVVWWFVTPAAPAWFAIGAGIAAGLAPYAVVVGCGEFGHRLAARRRRARAPAAVVSATRLTEPGGDQRGQLVGGEPADEKDLVAARRPAGQLDL